MTNAIRRHSGGLLACLLALGTLAPGAALGADPTPPQDVTSGKVGQHRSVESTEAPGATCRYGYETPDVGYVNALRRMSVRAPLAFASRQRERQRIALRASVESWDGAAWTEYRTSGWQSRFATPQRSADFLTTTLVTDPWGDDRLGPFRARLDLRWLSRDGQRIVGQAVLYPRHYRWVEGGVAAQVTDDRCGSTTG